MRVVIADDSVLLREGLARLLSEAGMEVVGFAGDAEGLLAGVAEQRPDVAIIDIRMPPTFTHEGAEAAARIRAGDSETGILLLSQTVESRHALELARTSPRKFGYLLKDRVLDVSMLIEAVQRVAAGGTVLDPDIVAHFLGRQGSLDRVNSLTEREREVLGLMAEGRSNQSIANAMVINERTVETYVAAIFSKLGLQPEPEHHRRVLAVLAWLQR
ncbi:MAG: response regulator transcription factor [bacterium]